ncbi:MAG TPA: hypothetical protein VI248_15785 [Kineosporiaceae bacterium]
MSNPAPLHAASLHAALRAHADGINPGEAAIELLINHGCFLARHDFRDRFIRLATIDGTTTADLDWPAAAEAAHHGGLPCSSSERQILQIAASLADGIPVNLRDSLTGLDHRNLHLVVTAILHAAGHPTTS